MRALRQNLSLRARRHPDHGEERRDEACAEQPVMHRRVVQVRRHREREDRTQMLGLLDGRLELGHREVADPQHSDVAITPGLRRRPLDEIVSVMTFLLVEEPERPTGTAGAPQVRDHMHVAARHPEVCGTCFDEAHRRAKVLDLARIRRRRNQDRVPAVIIGAVHVSQEHGAIAHRDRDVLVAARAVRRLGEVPIRSTGRLRTVELALPRFRTSNLGHAKTLRGGRRRSQARLMCGCRRSTSPRARRLLAPRPRPRNAPRTQEPGGHNDPDRRLRMSVDRTCSNSERTGSVIAKSKPGRAFDTRLLDASSKTSGRDCRSLLALASVRSRVPSFRAWFSQCRVRATSPSPWSSLFSPSR